MKSNTNKPPTIVLPPRLPKDEQELDRTIILLGNRKQTELNPRAQRELASLIGVYPTIAEATVWKRVMRRACQSINRDAKGNTLP